MCVVLCRHTSKLIVTMDHVQTKCLCVKDQIKDN